MCNRQGKQNEAAVAAFQGTDVQITIEDKRQLGAAIGTSAFVEEYVKQKVAGWVTEIGRLSSIAITQPHICCIHPWSHEQMDLPGQDHR